MVIDAIGVFVDALVVFVSTLDAFTVFVRTIDAFAVTGRTIDAVAVFVGIIVMLLRYLSVQPIRPYNQYCCSIYLCNRCRCGIAVCGMCWYNRYV